MSLRVRFVVAVFTVCVVFGCEGGKPSGGEGGGSQPGAANPASGNPRAQTGVAAPVKTSPFADEDNVFRLKNLAMLHSLRDTTDGYVTSAAAFERLLEIRPDPNDLLNLARLYCIAESWTPGVDQWVEAGKVLVRYVEEAKKKGNDLPVDVHYLVGMVAAHKADSKTAAERFRTVTKTAPHVKAAWFQLGSALLDLKEFQACVDALLKVVELDKDHVAAHYKIFRAYTRLRNKEQRTIWDQRFQAVKDRVGKVSDRDYEKCEFTSIRMRPTSRAEAQPHPVDLAYRELEVSNLPASARHLSVVDLHLNGDQELFVVGDSVRAMGLGHDEGAGSTLRGIESGDSKQLIPTELDNDEALDMLLVGSDGVVRVFEGAEEGFRVREGAAPTTPIAFLETIDYDHDGDLDVVAVTKEKTVEAWRNNGAGQLELIAGVFPGSLEDVAPNGHVTAADFDLQNDMDFVVGDSGGPAVLYMNLRAGPFRRTEIAGLEGHAIVLAVDLDNDSDIDLVGLPRAGVPFRIAWNDGAKSAGVMNPFRIEAVAEWKEGVEASAADFADVDNDGDFDLFVASSEGLQLWRNSAGTLSRETAEEVAFTSSTGSFRSVSAGDFDGDCLVDVAAIDSAGRVSVWMNSTRNAYERLVLRLVGGKDNERGKGAHVEIVAGQGYQRFMVDGLDGARVGLGTMKLSSLDGVSIQWPNGIRQAVLSDDVERDSHCSMRVIQKLGLVSSCPFLFVFDGTEYRFLTDVVSIAPIDEWLPNGAKPKLDPEEYVRIPGKLVARTDGKIRMAITEELRECTYLDRLQLIRVVHPEGHSVYVDESTRQPAIAPLELFVTRDSETVPAQGLRSDARGAAGTTCSMVDGRYFRPFEESHTQWSGWVEPFRFEIPLASAFETGESRSGLLLLTGRVAWFDSTISYSISQHGREWTPHAAVAIGTNGGETSLFEDAGVPTGMDRTMVIPFDLDKSARAIELRGTMRLLWDRVAFAKRAAQTELVVPGDQNVKLGANDVAIRSEILTPTKTELAWRGYSAIVGDDELHEHGYDFESASAWRTFQIPEGLATRFGDVAELTTTPDDKLVVMAPGDVLWLEFDAGEELKKGEAETYFLLVTGWAKENSFHNSTGRKIGPLPFRSMSEYPPKEDAPETEEYRAYLETYQTRRVRGG
ncbi:MAG: FG-GAP-like repeat-containing protein [Planctomycetota bacterium]